jgi:hypothetical protein
MLRDVEDEEMTLAGMSSHVQQCVRSIKSGRYESRVVAYGRAVSVDVRELYADEERRASCCSWTCQQSPKTKK